LGAIFILGSLGLFLLGSRKTSYSRFARRAPISVPAPNATMPMSKTKKVPVAATEKSAKAAPVGKGAPAKKEEKK